ncbi:MAG: tetratricopeptide repeat protein [Acidobacteria bacterium]|nr:tetratricopeptide repeat protein [Acidobacteriota bacterium]
MNLISLYARLGRGADAERHYRAAVAIDPKTADGHYNYGVMLAQAGRAAEAREAFSAALRANPRYAEAHNNLAFLLEQEGRLDEAIRHYRLAVESMPGHRLARYHLGRLLIGRGKPQEAIRHFRAALEPEDETTVGCLYGLATAYVRAGDLHSGLKNIRRARELAVAYRQTDLLPRIDHDIQALEKALRR